MLKQQGSILILTLFVLMVLSLTALSFAYRAGVTQRSASRQVIRIQLETEARSAVALALAGLASNTNDFDHRAEPWHSHPPFEGQPQLFSSEQNSAEPDPFQTTYHVIDEESKLHLHYASSNALETLGMTTSQIDSLFDWMDEDDDARPEGAENSYYGRLSRPYRTKNAPVEVLEELLAIRGFDEQNLLGEDHNRNRRLDPSEDDGTLSPPADNADGQLQMGWVDLLTLVGDGRINLNTAPRAVLTTLPISEQAVEQIVGYRRFDESSSGNLGEHVFAAPEDIEQLQGLSAADRTVLLQIGRFRSQHFRIFVHSRHPPTGMVYRLQVLARTGEDGARPEILQWQVGR